MNDYRYEEIEIGMSASFRVEITEDMMEKFRDISGDTNPLHTEEAFAKGKGFPGRVVYGMMTASLYSRLAGEYLPGKHCLLQSVAADFLAPVFVGDLLDISGGVVERDDSVRRIVLKAVIRNQNGKKVGRARIETGVT